ncbi:MAG: hypothetical protein E6R04_08070 [Spirochaetes bacterium]|nr:MAG: hypothetical protein E6R04_08070 [Spirochaetota bacterium]
MSVGGGGSRDLLQVEVEQRGLRVVGFEWLERSPVADELDVVQRAEIERADHVPDLAAPADGGDADRLADRLAVLVAVGDGEDDRRPEMPAALGAGAFLRVPGEVGERGVVVEGGAAADLVGAGCDFVADVVVVAYGVLVVEDGAVLGVVAARGLADAAGDGGAHVGEAEPPGVLERAFGDLVGAGGVRVDRPLQRLRGWIWCWCSAVLGAVGCPGYRCVGGTVSCVLQDVVCRALCRI